MSKPASLALLCLALRCVVIALPLPPAHSPPGTVLAPPPILQPPTLDNPYPLYEIQLRNRGMLMRVAFPADGKFDTSGDSWRKRPDHPKARPPSAEESEEIKYYLEKYKTAFAYLFERTGIPTRPKDNSDPRYYSGKAEFYDAEGYLLYATQCSHRDESILAPKKGNNAAEAGITAAIDICCGGPICCSFCPKQIGGK